MVCEKCGKKIAEDAVICSECGAPVGTDWEAMSPEERARKLWIQREKQRRKQKIVRDTEESAAAPEQTQVEMQTVDTPLAQDIRIAMAELSEEDAAEKTAEEEIEDINLAVQEAVNNAALNKEISDDDVAAETAEELQDTEMSESETLERSVQETIQQTAETEKSEQPREEEAMISILVDEAADDAIEQAKVESPEEELIPTIKEADAPEMISENSSVYINMEQAFEGREASEKDDFPDIRIPEIYAQAKYVPETEDAAKWAEKAAVDEENDWEGFDPDAADWGDWSEKEGRSNPFLIVLIVSILVVAAGLAIYSCATSELFLLF